MKRIFFIFILFVIICNQTAFAVRDTLISHDLKFIENKNQWDSKALFGVDVENGMLFLEKNCLTFNLVKSSDIKHSHAHHGYNKKFHSSDNVVHYHSYQVEFMNCNNAELIPSEKAFDYNNYFIGNDKSKWASNVLKYNVVNYKNIYDNIDFKLYSSNKFLKYDFIIKPFADPDKIQLKYKFINNIKISKGHLLIETSVNQIIELRPYCYQKINGVEKEVSCNYKLKKNVLSFELGDYDKSQPLIIDPSLIFSTYTGSTADNWGFTATYDLFGNVYSGGIVNGIGYPVSPGAYQQTGSGNWDIGIIKYDSLGISRMYATYLGGTFGEMPQSLIVNSSNQLLVYGTTGSANFPVTPNAYDTSFNGGQAINYDVVISYPNGVDIYVSKFSPDGTQLLASTFVGGSGNDGLNYRQYYDNSLMVGNDSLYFNYGDGARGEMITDDLSNVYVGTCTFSTDFPGTANSFQPTNHGKQEGIVFKLDYNLANLTWSSYVGGSEDDAIYSIDNDSQYDVYVTGGTASNNFPTTLGAYKTIFQGGTTDAFLTRISQNGSTLVASTYYGSNKYDQGYFVRCGRDDKVYIIGQTKADSNTLIYNAPYNVPNSGQFIAKFPRNLNGIVWSTVFGTGDGKPNISLTAFSVDICNRVYLAGWGRYWGGNPPTTWGSVFGTKNMAITPNAFQSITDGQDFYIMVMSDNATTLDYATYFGELYNAALPYSGRDHVDGGTSRFDKKGTVYQSVCASCGGYSLFPTFPNDVWSDSNRSFNCNNAVFKFNIHNDFALADFIDPPIGCAPDTITFQNTSIGTSYVWNFGDGSLLSTLVNPTHVYTHSGIYNVKLISTLLNGCNLADTIVKQIVVLDDTSYSIPNVHVCYGGNVQIGIPPNANPAYTYTWIPSNYLNDNSVSNPYANPPVNTNYRLLVSNGICADTISQTVVVHKMQVDAGNDTMICADSVKLTALTNENPVQFFWSSNNNFTDTLNANLNNSSAIVHISSANSYFWVKIKNQWCEGIDSVKVSSSFLSNPSVSQNPTCHDSCNGMAVVIPSGGSPPYTYLWSNGSANDTIFMLCAGIYTVMITDSINCKSFASITLNNPTPLILNPLVNHVPCTEACIGSINANASGSNPPYSYLWNTTQTTSTISNLCPGFYSVTVTDSKNCKAEDTASIWVNSIFTNVVVWADKDTIFKDLSTRLHATHLNNVSYSWFPAYGLNNTNIADPLAMPLVTTTYYLEMSDQYGCKHSDSITIFVIDQLCAEPYIFIPNGFTPNSDLQNDVFFVRSEILEEMNIKIFDRWGEKVFESNSTQNGWDGKYMGTYCQPGVFVYYFKGKCQNQKHYEKKGNITLIR
ncbi:MAG: gliding motility-associated C-terminal domain-containing protein [Bacteroidales bacterium]